MTIDAEKRELLAALRAIAEGYPTRGEQNRYIVVENPEFIEGEGSDPNLVIDTHTVTRALSSRPEGEALPPTDLCFDLLEAVADRIEANGDRDRANSLRSGFARGTGGIDLPFLITALARPTAQGEAEKLYQQLGGYQRIFNAIAESVEWKEGRQIGISVDKFVRAALSASHLIGRERHDH
jgi:hypothetical protein